MWQYGHKWWEAEDSSEDSPFVAIDTPLGECASFREALSDLMDFVEKEMTDDSIPQMSDLEALYAEMKDVLDKMDKCNEEFDREFVDNLGIEYYLAQI